MRACLAATAGTWGAKTLPLLLVVGACASGSTAPPSGGGGQPGPADWPRFGWDAGRAAAPSITAGVTAANRAALGRPQGAIDRPVGGAVSSLRGVPRNGSTHRGLFLTPTFGKTAASHS